MGDVLMGKTSHQENISMLTPEQQKLQSGLFKQLGPDFLSTFQQFLQPMGQEQMDATFQKSYVDPAMQTLQQQILPAVQQRYADANAGSSSALNQALAQSAADVSTQLGSQYGQFQQNQQLQQLQALGLMQPYLTGQTFTPLLQQQEGILGPLINAAGAIGAGAAMSSKDVKENIRRYEKGLIDLNKFDVKHYDYIEEFGGEKNCVGIIAEEAPEELTRDIAGIKHVDLYGLVGLLINSIKDLEKKVIMLEGIPCQQLLPKGKGFRLEKMDEVTSAEKISLGQAS